MGYSTVLIKTFYAKHSCEHLIIYNINSADIQLEVSFSGIHAHDW